MKGNEAEKEMGKVPGQTLLYHQKIGLSCFATSKVLFFFYTNNCKNTWKQGQISVNCTLSVQHVRQAATSTAKPILYSWYNTEVKGQGASSYFSDNSAVYKILQNHIQLYLCSFLSHLETVKT